MAALPKWEGGGGGLASLTNQVQFKLLSALFVFICIYCFYCVSSTVSAITPIVTEHGRNYYSCGDKKKIQNSSKGLRPNMVVFAWTRSRSQAA